MARAAGKGCRATAVSLPRAFDFIRGREWRHSRFAGLFSSSWRVCLGFRRARLSALVGVNRKRSGPFHDASRWPSRRGARRLGVLTAVGRLLPWTGAGTAQRDPHLNRIGPSTWGLAVRTQPAHCSSWLLVGAEEPGKLITVCISPNPFLNLSALAEPP